MSGWNVLCGMKRCVYLPVYVHVCINLNKFVYNMIKRYYMYTRWCDRDDDGGHANLIKIFGLLVAHILYALLTGAKRFCDRLGWSKTERTIVRAPVVTATPITDVKRTRSIIDLIFLLLTQRIDVSCSENWFKIHLRSFVYEKFNRDNWKCSINQRRFFSKLNKSSLNIVLVNSFSFIQMHS